MKFTDKEKEDLKKLSADELIDLLEASKTVAENDSETARKEREKIIKAFLDGGEQGAQPPKEEEPAPEDKAFTKLKNKIF